MTRKNRYNTKNLPVNIPPEIYHYNPVTEYEALQTICDVEMPELNRKKWRSEDLADHIDKKKSLEALKRISKDWSRIRICMNMIKIGLK
jgi:hypothetical protein